MKKQPNYWIMALLGGLINLGVTFGLIMMKKDQFVVTPEEVVEEIIIGSPEHFDFLTHSIDDLILNLEQEKVKLDKREKLIRELEERVNLEHSELSKIRDEILAYRKDLTKDVIKLEAGEEKNLKSLAVTYSNISAEAAVAVFEEMDDVFVVKILSYMPTDAVAPIFQQMAKTRGENGPMSERVARFSEMIRLKIDVEKEK